MILNSVKNWMVKCLYDIMLANTDAKLVIQQLDIGNLYNGGANAIEDCKKIPGTFFITSCKR